jgi:integrase
VKISCCFVPDAEDLSASRVFARDHFKPLVRSAGLPAIRLYDLRHTAATISLIGGVSPKIFSEQLGPASVAFTLNSHVLPHIQDEALEKVHKPSSSVSLLHEATAGRLKSLIL